ncbi:hypothetical protein NAG74_31175 [Sinorhizobium meliloti]|nr:hypothetical protein [Sinorhizobium meliloti]MCO5966154.1 hypothetical protein [Sinorhizobium meliloti]
MDLVIANASATAERPAFSTSHPAPMPESASEVILHISPCLPLRSVKPGKHRLELNVLGAKLFIQKSLQSLVVCLKRRKLFEGDPMFDRRGFDYPIFFHLH